MARPDLQATPLHLLPRLASSLGLAELSVKDETHRFSLNALKAVGATFAIATVKARGLFLPGATLACASEGDHGRAVARSARLEGCSAVVYVADWLIMLEYTRLLDEVEAQSASQPDVIFVQAGVGGLLAAAACWADWRYGTQRPSIVAVEPLSAACVQASVRANAPTVVGGPLRTIMGGLRCGEMSPVAFGAIRSIVDGYIAIEDEWARAAVRRLALPVSDDPPIEAGASGAASLAGLLAALGDPSADELRQSLHLGDESRVLVIVTEGVTDPESFAAVFDGRS